VWALSLACALVAVFCALMTYRYIEHPFIAKRNTPRPVRRTLEAAREHHTAAL
jgi:peptidoglycan/LPS O-acetylase OafA/YrhL